MEVLSGLLLDRFLFLSKLIVLSVFPSDKNIICPFEYRLDVVAFIQKLGAHVLYPFFFVLPLCIHFRNAFCVAIRTGLRELPARGAPRWVVMLRRCGPRGGRVGRFVGFGHIEFTLWIKPVIKYKCYLELI